MKAREKESGSIHVKFLKKNTRRYFRHDFTYLFILEKKNEGKRGDQREQGRENRLEGTKDD